MLEKFITTHYHDIITMSKKITKNSIQHEEIAHHIIELFLKNKKNIILIQNNEAMKYISGMIHRNYYSKTSSYYKIYGNKTLPLFDIHESNIIDYDLVDEENILIDKIEEIINNKNNDPKLYYQIELLKLYSETPNYSKLSRELNIPRTSIVLAIKNAKEYIKNKIK